MSVPSMVYHRSGGNLAVRNVVSDDAFHEPAADVSDADEDVVVDERPAANDRSKELPDCKVRRNYTCSSCDFFTQNPRLYLYHLRDEHKQKIKVFECPSCLYASKHFQKLLRHSKMVHGTSEGVSVAETSRKSRRRSANDVGDECEEPQEPLQEHQDEEVEIDEMLPEDPDRPAVFKCSVCEFTSRNRMQLSKHEREEHIKTKFFRCSKCTYVTHIKARYTKHVKYHSMPMIKCDMCDFRTPYKWNLDRHCKNHNGKGAFRCSACNFTADIKQSLTVHEMNHHVPPVGQAAGLGVGRRRNKVGASDTTAAEEAAAANQETTQIVQSPETELLEEPQRVRPKIKITPKKAKLSTSASTNGVIRESSQGKHSDFIHPDDIIQHSNGKVYIKNKCSLCNFKTAWSSEMAKHEKHFHNIGRDLNSEKIKKASRPVPNLIPIPFQTKRSTLADQDREPMMSQSDINEICSRSGNSALKDFASLFVCEEVFKNPSTSKVPDLIPTSMFTAKKNNTEFKQKNASFFDHLKEKLELGTGCNLFCDLCGHESKCLTEQAKHKKICGKESNKISSIIPVHNISASRCQYCRQRCKSSADLYNHLQKCAIAIKYFHSEDIKQEDDTSSEHENELKIDEDRHSVDGELENKPHPMENKVFVWNDIMVPMDIDVDDSNYEYTEDRIDDNVSLDLSIRTQSPANSENSYVGPENNNNINTNHNIQTNVQHSPVPAHTEKIPTHGNDISVAQHKRVFKCPHCTFWASTASRFHVHIVGHLNKKPFECSLCSYRSNWRWDITKHIKLKSVRDQAHESAKVLMTDETGRRNYTKYNKYLTEIPLSSLQSSNETSGGSGTRPRSHDKNSTPSTSKSDKANKFPTSGDFNSLLKVSNIRQPNYKASEKQLLSNVTQEKKSKSNSDNKRTLFKCKKCNFRDASRDILLQHVKGHYEQPDLDSQEQLLQQAVAAAQVTVTPAALSLLASPSPGGMFSSQDLSLRGTSPDRDEASVNNSPATKGGSATNAAPFRCGHCNQVSNWKHVIQRHCRLKHSGDIRVVSTKNGQEKIEIDEQIDEPDDIDTPYLGAFKCDICPYNIDNQEKFQHHQSGHYTQSDSALTCSFCRFGAADDKELQDHIRLHSRKFRCALCPYETNSKSQYTYHKQFHKDRGGQYTCSQCSYNVSKRHLLHQHLKVHGISVPSVKHSEDVNEVSENSNEPEETLSDKPNLDMCHFADIPLVWVSKNGKFSKMFKCRYCPHVNLRKVNIQEHEKMHSVRDKSTTNSKTNEIEHRCTECNYVCNNAGVLSSHVKVHQGQCGIVHCLVDPVQSDEEQIRELTRALGIADAIDTSEFLEVEMEEVDTSSENVLYFCEECPARFLKENEYSIHKEFHFKDLEFKCNHCSYAAESEQYLNAHLKTHTDDYQNRTKMLKSFYPVSPQQPEPSNLKQVSRSDGDSFWIIDNTGKSKLEQSNNILASFLSKPLKSSQTVPLSGTDLFQQRSEAQQRQSLKAAQSENVTSFRSNKSPDPQFGDLMLGNPDFTYQTCIKNGRAKEKRYKCHKCPSAFEKREQYRIHINLHGSNQRYNCTDCDYSVKYFANFKQHLTKHKFSDDAQAAKKTVNGVESEENQSPDPEEILDPESEIPDENNIKEEKTYWCPHCPYVNEREHSLEIHVQRHQSVSGIKDAYTCKHCDYSVPQAHILEDHEKLHFIPNKAKYINGYMICDNLKLTSSNLEASKDSDVNVIYEDSSDSKDDEEKFNNNNKGENQVINVQTGELDVKKDVSDLNVENTNFEMEVN